MQAIDIMQANVVSVPMGTPLVDAARLLLAHGINAIPVRRADGRVIGMIGIRDVLRAPIPSHSDTPILLWDSLEEKARQLGTLAVDDGMTRRQLLSVAPQASIVEVASIMANRGVHPLLVLADGELLGVIGRADVARALLTLAQTTGDDTLPHEAME